MLCLLAGFEMNYGRFVICTSVEDRCAYPIIVLNIYARMNDDLSV